MKGVAKRRILAIAAATTFLAGCSAGGDEAVEEAPVLPPPPASEPAEKSSEEPKEEYWTSERLATLDESKQGFEPPQPEASSRVNSDESAASSQVDSNVPASSPASMPATQAVETNDSSPPPEVQAEQQKQQSLSGTLVVIAALREHGYADKRCDNAGRAAGRGYDDIGDGAEIRIRDAQGSIIGITRLSGGSFRDIGDGLEACTWDFGPAEVPLTDFYTIEATHRDGVTFSRSDLEATGWKAALSL